MIAFRAAERMVRFTINMPDLEDFKRTPSGRRSRSPAQQQVEWEKAGRQRWRALALVVKAKLEAVDSGITTFEEEFLSFIMLPNGQTVYEATRDGVEQAYVDGKMPALLMPGSDDLEATT
jgi:hypothetical protein